MTTPALKPVIRCESTVKPGDVDWPGYPANLPEIAEHFRRLDGKVGVTPGHLRRLIRRFGLPRKATA